MVRSTGLRARHAVSAIAAAWVLSLGFDLLLHAGLLARLYAQPSPFLLEPEEAFRRIPLGYLAFLVLTIALYWLLRRLGVRGVGAGLRLGLVAGLVIWGAMGIGLYSISTARPSLLAGWWAGQALELGLAGAVLGAAEDGVSLRRIWMGVVVAVLGCVVATVLAQSLGWVPVMKIEH